MKFGIEPILNSLDSGLATICNENIIDIEGHNGAFFGVYKDTVIRFDREQAQFLHILREMLVSDSEGLLEIIESLV